MFFGTPCISLNFDENFFSVLHDGVTHIISSKVNSEKYKVKYNFYTQLINLQKKIHFTNFKYKILFSERKFSVD